METMTFTMESMQTLESDKLPEANRKSLEKDPSTGERASTDEWACMSTSSTSTVTSPQIPGK